MIYIPTRLRFKYKKMTTKDLKPNEYSSFYRTYIDLIPKELTLIEGYRGGLKNVETFFSSIPEEKLNYVYAAEKWTVKEILQHIIDAERVFMYRCFRIARHDATPLSGFDENNYIVPSLAGNKSLDSLLEEYKAVRHSSIVLLQSLKDEDLAFIGNANGNNMSARAAAFSVLGHELWHIKIIRERYL